MTPQRWSVRLTLHLPVSSWLQATKFDFQTVHIKLATVSTLHAACSYFLVKIVRVISICLRGLVFRIPPDCWDQYLISGIKAPSSKPDCDMRMGVVLLHFITPGQCTEWRPSLHWKFSVARSPRSSIEANQCTSWNCHSRISKVTFRSYK
jgi:hypothetical protein